MILNQLPPGYQSFVKATPHSQNEDMVPEPDFKHNTLMKAAYQSVQISPSEDDPCASVMLVYYPSVFISSSVRRGAMLCLRMISTHRHLACRTHMTVYQGDIILIQYHLIKDLVLAEEVRLL